jgi:cytochrome c
MATSNRGRSLIAALGVLASFGAVPPARAQSSSFGLGRTPTPAEIKAIDIDILPDGTGLPAGAGTAREGKQVYESRCVTCHGATAKEGPQDVLVGGQGTLNMAKPIKTVGSYWPYATTLWDYVRRAMPFDHPGTLSINDVYSATAYVLFLNGIIDEHDVLDQTTLSKVKMPNRAGFMPDTRPDTGPKPARASRLTHH